MDMMMVDVTDVAGAAVGDEVTLLGAERQPDGQANGQGDAALITAVLALVSSHITPVHRAAAARALDKELPRAT